MPRRLKSVLLIAAALPLFTSCNIYAPFALPVSDQDFIDAALHCLHEGNYECAVDYYNQLTDGETKNQKLCQVNIARAGMDLTALLEIATDDSVGDAILAEMAEALLPYSDEKLTAAIEAVYRCGLLTGTTDVIVLLKSLAYLVDCSIRIAKTDTIQDTSAAVGSCNADVDGDASGTITASDVGGDTNAPPAPTAGELSVANPGMCSIDVDRCVSNLEAIEALGVPGGPFQSFFDNISSLPPELLDDTTATNLARWHIQDRTP